MSDDNWRAAVRYFFSHAAAVVIVVGRTESVWWEIETALREVKVQRMLFFFPYAEEKQRRRTVWSRYADFLMLGLTSKSAFAQMDAERNARYQLFRQRAQALLSAPLPANLGRSLFVDFLMDGAPRLLEFRRTYQAAIVWSFLRFSHTQISFGRTLKPFLKKLNTMELQFDSS